MKRVALESPYAARGPLTVDDHVRYARLAMADCLRRGEAPIASHLLYPQVLDDLKPEQRTLGIEAGMIWSATADYAVFYVDLGVSHGMALARDFYIRTRKPCELRFLFSSGTARAIQDGDITLTEAEKVL